MSSTRSPTHLRWHTSGIAYSQYKPIHQEEPAMVDRNYVEGAMENVAGKVEEGAGYLTGSPGARLEGKARQVAGNAQSALGRAKDTMAKSSEEMRSAARRSPMSALLIAGVIGFALGRILFR